VRVTFGPVVTLVRTLRVTVSDVLPNITSRSPEAAYSTSLTTTPEVMLRKKAPNLLMDELTVTLVNRFLRNPPGLLMASAMFSKDDRTTLIAPLTALTVDEITTAAESVRVRLDSLLSADVTVIAELRFLRLGNSPVIV
jgi:hypothetical protein